MRKLTPSIPEAIALVVAIFLCTFWSLHVSTLLITSNLDFPYVIFYAVKHAGSHMFSWDVLDIVVSSDTVPFILVCMFLPLIVYTTAKFRNGNFRPGEEHGSARLLSTKEVSRYADKKEKQNNFILSKNARLRLGGRAENPEYQRNNNVLIIGNPGTGKTRFIVKPNLMQLNCSYVITDPKGSLFPETGHLFEQAGYNVCLFDTIHPERSMHFNPFAFVRKNTPEHPDNQKNDLFNIMQTLWQNLSEKNPNASTDPFWEDSAQALLTSVAMFMFEITEGGYEDRRTFRFLMELISLMDFEENQVSPLDVLMEIWETGKLADEGNTKQTMFDQAKTQLDIEFSCGEHPDSVAVRMYKKNRKGAAKTLQSVFSTINKSTWKFELEEVLKLTDTNDFDLRHVGGYAPDDLKEAKKKNPHLTNPGKGVACGVIPGIADKGQQKTVIYICMKDKNKFYSFLIALFESILLDQLLEYADTECPGASLPIPVQFWLDEFANIGKIADFEVVLNTLRSRNIGCSIILQMITQLDAVYGKDSRGMFEGGCDTHICLGTTDWETCKYISEVSGKSTVDVRNMNKSFGQQKSYSLGEAMHERALLTPDEVRGLPRSKTLVMFTDGMYKDDKYDIADHTNYQFIDPGHKGAAFDSPFTSQMLLERASNRRNIEGAYTNIYQPEGVDKTQLAEVEPEEDFSIGESLVWEVKLLEQEAYAKNPAQVFGLPRVSYDEEIAKQKLPDLESRFGKKKLEEFLNTELTDTDVPDWSEVTEAQLDSPEDE